MRVVLTEEATNDLVRIGEFIKRDNPSRAASFVNELEDRCRRLVEMPYGHPLLLDHEKTGIRRRGHGKYLIFYKIDDDVIEVLHVLHGARDYEAILFPTS